MTGVAKKRAAAEALELSRLAERLSTSASVMSEAAKAIQVAAAVALGQPGVPAVPQDEPPPSEDDPTQNPFVNDQDIDFIKDLMRQQNEAASSFQGCLNSYRDAVDAALMTTEPGTPMRNKMMTAAYQRYVACCRLPKALIVAPDDS